METAPAEPKARAQLVSGTSGCAVDTEAHSAAITGAGDVILDHHRPANHQQ